MSKRLVIIGADAAGMSAAGRAKRLDDDLEIIAFERGSFSSYAACGLPYLVGGEVPSAQRLVARTPEQHRANGIDLRMRHEVVSIDPQSQIIRVHDLEGDAVISVPYDDLLIATGAEPIRPRVEGIDGKGIMGIHTIPDARSITSIVDERTPQRVVVVGGGYIGIEMAEAFLTRGLAVTVVEGREAPMATMDPEMGDRITRAMIDQGITVRLGTTLEGFVLDAQGWVAAAATSAGEIPADLVVMGLGVRPSVSLARSAGVPIGPSGAIAVDARQATRSAGIWAAGDCAESLHRLTHAPVWIALGTHANKQGRVAGTNLAGGNARFEGVIGTAITKIGSTEIARTGLNESEARDAGFTTICGTATGHTRAGYYPDASPLAVKVIADQLTGRMLGAQIVGGPESAKRIDTLATAVWCGLDVDSFEHLDLAYAPPFAPVWETSMIAARMAGDRRS